MKGTDVDDIQTGSGTVEIYPLPRRIPGASFLEFGWPPALLPRSPRRGRHRKPQSFALIRHMFAVLVLTALALGSCGTPAPAATRWTTPTAAGRVIEVVDRITPARWRVGEAAEWLDRLTASDMRLVAKCSGTAYRCITVRQGTLSGRRVGWAKGDIVTIDTAKMRRGGCDTEVYRKRLLVHEIAHTFGLHHAGAGNLMAPTVDRMRLSLTAGQRAHLAVR